jgi:hypothetical protein
VIWPIRSQKPIRLPPKKTTQAIAMASRPSTKLAPGPRARSASGRELLRWVFDYSAASAVRPESVATTIKGALSRSVIR